VSVRAAVWTGWIATALLAGIGLLTQWPPSAESYRQEAIAAAQQTLDATGTAMLLGESDLEGDLLPMYLTEGLSTAQLEAATALEALLGAEIPDENAQAIRDQLQPVFTDATATIGTLAAALDADDTERAATAISRLRPLHETLRRFVQDNE
jgi:hypothetical protein